MSIGQEKLSIVSYEVTDETSDNPPEIVQTERKFYEKA
jgi:hypothetical protein